MVRSGVVDYKGPFILQRDFTPNFPLRLMHKDIRLTLEAAKEARVKLPALETVEEIYEMATEDGNQDLDYAATLTLLEKWAGVQVKGEAARTAQKSVSSFRFQVFAAAQTRNLKLETFREVPVLP